MAQISILAKEIFSMLLISSKLAFLKFPWTAKYGKALCSAKQLMFISMLE